MAKFKTLNVDASKRRALSNTQYLWVCVLGRAVQDALISYDWVEARRAMVWFESASSDFKLVCEYAGRNPVYVQEKMMPKINKRKQSMTEVKEKYGTRFTKIVYKFNDGEWISEHRPQNNM